MGADLVKHLKLDCTEMYDQAFSDFPPDLPLANSWEHPYQPGEHTIHHSSFAQITLMIEGSAFYGSGQFSIRAVSSKLPKLLIYIYFRPVF